MHACRKCRYARRLLTLVECNLNVTFLSNTVTLIERTFLFSEVLDEYEMPQQKKKASSEYAKGSDCRKY